MAGPTFLAPLLGFGPALAILLFALRKYDGFFDDRKVFMTLLLGMGMGFVVAVFNAYLHPSLLLTWEALILVFILALPIFEELFKLIVLNLKRFHGRFDTTFYGLSMGIGIGALVLLAFVQLYTFDMSGVNALIILGYSFGVIFLNGSTGALIGFGVYRRRPFMGLTYAIGFHIAGNLAIFPFLDNQDVASLSLLSFLMVGALAFIFVYTKVLPRTLPEDLKKLIRRYERKRQREDEDKDLKTMRIEMIEKLKEMEESEKSSSKKKWSGSKIEAYDDDDDDEEDGQVYLKVKKKDAQYLDISDSDDDNDTDEDADND